MGETTIGEEWDEMMECVEDEEDIDFFESEIRMYEDSHIKEITKRIKKFKLGFEIEQALKNNMTSRGLAYMAFIEAMEAGDVEEAEELLDRIEIARDRHMNTDYEALLQAGASKEEARFLK